MKRENKIHNAESFLNFGIFFPMGCCIFWFPKALGMLKTPFKAAHVCICLYCCSKIIQCLQYWIQDLVGVVLAKISLWNVSKLFRLFNSKDICRVHVNFGWGWTYFFKTCLLILKIKTEAAIIMNPIVRKMYPIRILKPVFFLSSILPSKCPVIEK